MKFLCGLKEGHLPFTARIKVGPAGGQRVRMKGWAGEREKESGISSQCAMVMISKVTNKIMISLRRQGALAGRHAIGEKGK